MKRVAFVNSISHRITNLKRFFKALEKYFLTNEFLGWNSINRLQWPVTMETNNETRATLQRVIVMPNFIIKNSTFLQTALPRFN